jgi:hypothetical protein
MTSTNDEVGMMNDEWTADRAVDGGHNLGCPSDSSFIIHHSSLV